MEGKDFAVLKRHANFQYCFLRMLLASLKDEKRFVDNICYRNNGYHGYGLILLDLDGLRQEIERVCGYFWFRDIKLFVSSQLKCFGDEK
jgi:hypothetical protein